MAMFQMGKLRLVGGLEGVTQSRCPGIGMGLGLGPGPWPATGASSPSCLGEWSARGQFCPVWHLVAGWSCPVCTLPRATLPGGMREPWVCPHKRIWSVAALIPPFGLLMEPSSTCLGAEVTLAGKVQQGPSKAPIRQPRGARSSPC